MKFIPLWLLTLFLGSSNFLFAQKAETFTISGYIQDLDSGEKLITANVYDYRSEKGAVSNTYGFYSLTLPKDSVLLTISYIGYKNQTLALYLDKDITLNIDLAAELSFQEIEVVAKKQDKIEERSRMSTVEVPIAQIKQIPALFGEVDVLKALQLLPGVQSGGEGQNGLYVRGGSPDQNLILLDGVPVYNASHLFGFFSVFNADAIKDVTLTKGGFPARYGGRLSSVIEINMKEGDLNDWHGTGTIGLIASKLTLEGPIKKDKTSILISGRRTYIDLLAKPLIKKNFEDEGSSGTVGYFFHDINAKINHKISDKDRLYFSVYAGKDKFYFEEDDSYIDNGFKNEYSTKAGLQWGNVTSALRWNHLWNNKLFSNSTLTYSQYKFDTTAEERDLYEDEQGRSLSSFSLNYLSGINDLTAKIDFDFIPNPDHYIRFGVSGIRHTFKPGAFDINIRSEEDSDVFTLDTLLGQPNVSAWEYTAYVEDDMQIGENFKVNGGLHFSGFSTTDKTYLSLQPRLGMRYLLPDGTALKASYAQMRQYVQLLTNDGIGLPTDLWLPTTNRVKPQDSWQVALGAAKTFNKKYEISVEAYYKDMTNLISYKEGSSLFQLNDWQDRVTQGDGKSFGAEFFLQKKIGRLTGWLGYTWSKTNRTFPEINFGKTFDYKYDRRHDISIVAAYKITDRIRVSGTWVFGTGNAVTLANSNYNVSYPDPGRITRAGGGRYETGNLDFYEERNNFRMKPYHRMDIGIEFSKQKKRYKRTWSLGAYNVYNNKNPFFVFVSSEFQGNQSVNVLKQASLFPVLPYFAWRFEF